MFMSIFLATPSGSWDFPVQPLRLLHEQLQAVEGHRDIFQKAFPDDNGTYMANFRKVMDAETLRERDPEGQMPQSRHDRRHDAESIYWVFLWSFGRARQLGTDPPEDGSFMAFCKAMLQHSMAGPAGQKARAYWLRPGELRELFAPDLKPVELLFQRFAAYLGIPWHLYCGAGGAMEHHPDHAHIAMRRLILAFKLPEKNRDTLSIRLDTASPRVTTVFDFDARMFATTDKRGASDASETAPPLVTRLSTAIQRQAEAEAAAATDNVCGPKKTHATTADDIFEGADPPSSPTPASANEDLDPLESSGSSKEGAELFEPQDPPEQHYDPDVHRDAHSANALRLMFRKDRELWFGRGT